MRVIPRTQTLLGIIFKRNKAARSSIVFPGIGLMCGITSHVFAHKSLGGFPPKETCISCLMHEGWVGEQHISV